MYITVNSREPGTSDPQLAGGISTSTSTSTTCGQAAPPWLLPELWTNTETAEVPPRFCINRVPDDVLAQVLLRVPLVDGARATTVCKRWHNLLCHQGVLWENVMFPGTAWPGVHRLCAHLRHTRELKLPGKARLLAPMECVQLLQAMSPEHARVVQLDVACPPGPASCLGTVFEALGRLRSLICWYPKKSPKLMTGQQPCRPWRLALRTSAH